jgi:hypothetical protein
MHRPYAQGRPLDNDWIQRSRAVTKVVHASIIRQENGLVDGLLACPGMQGATTVRAACVMPLVAHALF